MGIGGRGRSFPPGLPLLIDGPVDPGSVKLVSQVLEWCVINIGDIMFRTVLSERDISRLAPRIYAASYIHG